MAVKTLSELIKRLNKLKKQDIEIKATRTNIP